VSERKREARANGWVIDLNFCPSDARRLIEALDKALSETVKRAELAESKALKSERALAVACAQASSAITTDLNGRSKPAPSK
jgi:uncharacterized protein